jgi:hypothetical protein
MTCVKNKLVNGRRLTRFPRKSFGIRGLCKIESWQKIVERRKRLSPGRNAYVKNPPYAWYAVCVCVCSEYCIYTVQSVQLSISLDWQRRLNIVKVEGVQRSYILLSFVNQNYSLRHFRCLPRVILLVADCWVWNKTFHNIDEINRKL